MKIFVNNQKRAKIRKKRRQIDPSQVSGFLNRPVKKPQDLNQNLRNSYQKKFFDGPRFEHFKKLRSLRKGKETDSILSSDHQDEDYQDSFKKISKKKTKTIKQEQKQIKKEKSLIYEKERDEQIIPSSKIAKKMAKRPVKKEVSSQSSISRSSSSATSSESSSQSVTNTLSQTGTKQEPVTKFQSSSANIDKIVPLKIVSKVKFERQSSCEPSDEPEHIPDAISKPNEQNPKEKKIILKSEKKTMAQTNETINQSFEKAQKNLEATALPINRVSKLSLISRVIVESIYLCVNHSTNNNSLESAIDFRKKWQILSSLFQHAPCCHFTHQKNNRSFQDYDIQNKEEKGKKDHKERADQEEK